MCSQEAHDTMLPFFFVTFIAFSENKEEIAPETRETDE